MTRSDVLLTLAGLQHRLEALPVGQQLTLAATDYRRLFGINDIAQERVDNFAEGHGCVAEPTPSTIVFRKVRAVKSAAG